MDDLKNALKKALVADSPLQAREQTPDPEPPGMPDPKGSPWVRALASHLPIPKDASVGRLRQMTDSHVKTLRAQGRDRDAKELSRLRDDWIRAAELEIWGQIKARFAALELSEKAYRSIKQGTKLSPEALLKKLHTRRAEELRGASPERLRAWLEP